MPGKEKGNGPRRYKGNRLFRPPSGLLSSVVCPEVTAASSTRTPSATHSTSDTSVVSQESVPDPAIPASGSGFSRVVYMHGSPPRSTRGDLSHSVSADALVPRTALDHLLASLDNDARRKGDPVCRSVSATTLSMETPLPSPPAVRAIPTPVGIDECAVSDTESDHSIESRHVYFDEQRLHKQSSLQVLRHEARMRRVAFQNATHYDKRYAMDSLMQTLQAQIEDAGSRLRGVPGAADQWSLQAPRAPCELSYTVRQTPRSRAPASLPTWQGPVNSARPFAFHLAISLTFHAPLLCRRAPTTASMRLVRVSLAHGFVLSAFHAKEARSGRAEPHDTRPNPVLLLLPRFVLVSMVHILSIGCRYSDENALPWCMAPLLRTHRQWQKQLDLLHLALPAVLLHSTEVLLKALMQLALLATQLAVCVFVTITHSTCWFIAPRRARNADTNRIL